MQYLFFPAKLVHIYILFEKFWMISFHDYLLVFWHQALSCVFTAGLALASSPCKQLEG